MTNKAAPQVSLIPKADLDYVQAQLTEAKNTIVELQAANAELEKLTASLAPAEAGFSLNWQMVDKNGATVGLTMRGRTVEDWAEIFKARHAFVEKATEAGWKFPPQPEKAEVGNGNGAKPAAAGQPAQADKPYYWKANNGNLVLKNGKAILVLRNGGSEPESIDCPLHPGKPLKRRTNDNGAWLSHKNGDGYCSAIFEHEQA